MHQLLEVQWVGGKPKREERPSSRMLREGPYVRCGLAVSPGNRGSHTARSGQEPGTSIYVYCGLRRGSICSVRCPAPVVRYITPPPAVSYAAPAPVVLQCANSRSVLRCTFTCG